ncbi:MAG: hypothetical protein SPL08_00900 [Pseudomonadota bacterium]|nr:hypothetical protein [Pseudomonadota bacterium]
MKKYALLMIILCWVIAPKAGIYSFPINPPRELDFSDKEEIFRVRNKMISDYPIFFQGAYHADTSSVFRQIEGGKPWWGLKGLLCYGPGKLSIEGESDESRFIDNPFLLISVEEGFALVLTNENGYCPLSYPEPTQISFETDTMTFSVDYNMSSHEGVIENIAKNNHMRAPHMQYSFNGRNAIDFGVPYVYAERTENIRFTQQKNISNHIYRFRDFIHVGGSCGYPGGCNNGSPHQPETSFVIEGYPATATFKLWRNAPKTIDEPADLIYQINIR